MADFHKNVCNVHFDENKKTIISFEDIFKLLNNKDLLLMFDNYTYVSDKENVDRILIDLKNKFNNYMMVIKEEKDPNISGFNNFKLTNKRVEKRDFNFRVTPNISIDGCKDATSLSFILCRTEKELNSIHNKSDLFDLTITSYLKKRLLWINKDEQSFLFDFFTKNKGWTLKLKKWAK